jgi:hypothetical protein
MKTVREESVGQLTFRLLQMEGRFCGVVLGAPGGRIGPISGSNAEQVWCQLHEAAGKADREYFGFDGARARFLRFFPQGFRTPSYFETEREYKLRAKQRLDATVPLAEALSGTGFGQAVLAAYHATNLLSHFETIALQRVLRGTSADPFVRAAAHFAQGAGAPALHEMERILRPYDSARWTVVTYLPFLWRPDFHIFLKPEVTQDFAARIGHRFRLDYQPRLSPSVYESLLDMVAQTERVLVDLRPRDRIDMQSFIWVVGSYDEAGAAPTT